MNTEKLPIRLATLDVDIGGKIDNLCLGLPDPLRQEATAVCRRYLKRNLSIVRHSLTSRKKVEEFYAACKSRSEEFVRIVGSIIHYIRVANDLDVIVHVTENGAFTDITINEEVAVTYKDFYPSTHRSLLNGLVVINKIEEESIMIHYLRILTTISMWYKDFRWDDKDIISQIEEESFDRVFDSEPIAPVDYSQSYYSSNVDQFCFLESKSDRELPYCIRRLKSNFGKAIRRGLPKSIFNVNYPYYNSLKSSGMYNHTDKETVPALFASQFEIESESIKTINGFNLDLESLYETRDPDFRVEGADYGKSITIEQKKLERRLIHISPNFIQDRLVPYHYLSAAVLRSLRTDCTFNQRKGYLQTKQWTNPQFRDCAVLSLDLSKATDTWDIRHQKHVLSNVLRVRDPENADQLADEWVQLMQFPTYAHGKLRSMKYGQPQGRLSSFPVFALAHHEVIIHSLIDLHLEQNCIDDDDYIDYVILGDDSCIILPDRYAELYKEIYIRNMRSLNVVCNPDKGYTSRANQPKISEFAKVLAVDDIFITPIPWNLLSQSTTPEGQLKLIIWLLTYGNDIDIELMISQSLWSSEQDSKTLCAIVACISDIQSNSTKYLDVYYDHRDKSVINYFYDKWYLRDSILFKLLDTKAADRIQDNYCESQFALEFKNQLKKFSKYFDKSNKKIYDLYDEFAVREIILDKLSLDITLTDEESEVARCLLSTLAQGEFNLESTLDQALEILGEIDIQFPEDYDRNPDFVKITNLLRQRSFISEFNILTNEKFQELITFMSPTQSDDEYWDEILADFFI